MRSPRIKPTPLPTRPPDWFPLSYMQRMTQSSRGTGSVCSGGRCHRLLSCFWWFQEFLCPLYRDVGPCESYNRVLEAMGEAIIISHWGGVTGWRRRYRPGCYNLTKRVVVPPPLTPHGLQRILEISPYLRNRTAGCVLF